jgi:eukaryotic-like serine/threonine-protein kinase
MTQTSQTNRSGHVRTARPWSAGSQSAGAFAPSHDGSLPNQAGGWRLEGLLGEGTYARVFAARPARSSSAGPAPYALKMLRPQWQDRPAGLGMIRREAAVGRAVAHPHLISVLAANLDEPPYFVVMPRLAGQTLAARLNNLPLPPGEGQGEGAWLNIPLALWIARQTAEAAAALHRRGFLHNDIKPANVWLAPTGHVTLLDLSFARPMNDPGSVADRPLLGTVGYLAPEQIVSALRADERSDIYSLGVMLYEMLSGRLPFAADNVSDLLRLHREQRPRYVRSWRPEAPAEVANLLREMLAKDPLRRPDSMDEIVRRLISLEIDTLAEHVRV